MVVALVVALFVLGSLLLAFDTFALGVGVTGLFSGRGLERCAGCGHWGLAERGMVHPRGCPSRHRSLRHRAASRADPAGGADRFGPS